MLSENIKNIIKIFVTILILIVFLIFVLDAVLNGDKEVLIPEKFNNINNLSEGIDSEGNSYYIDCSKEIEFEEKVVRGDSMYPAFVDGERIKVFRGYYDCNRVNRGDVVLIQQVKRDTESIKFIKAIPGDTMEIKGRNNSFSIYINGEKLLNSEGEPYVLEEDRTLEINAYIKADNGVVIDGYYLILGNNTKGSEDSTTYGLYSKGSITAYVEKFD